MRWTQGGRRGALVSLVSSGLESSFFTTACDWSCFGVDFSPLSSSHG